jgi:hypothetical protein
MRPYRAPHRGGRFRQPLIGDGEVLFVVRRITAKNVASHTGLHG